MAAAKKNLSVICYDFPTVSSFFRSCALAVAIEKNTSLEWKDAELGRYLGAIYSVLFWKGAPGTVEVDMGQKAEVERKVDELHQHYLFVWIRMLFEEGPARAQQYVADMDRVRGLAISSVEEVFQEQRGLMAGILGETRNGIRQLAEIKLAAQVGVAVIGAIAGVAFVGAAAAGAAAGKGMLVLSLKAGAGATFFAGVGAAHSVTHSVIKNWDKGATAQVVGIRMEVGKAGASEIGGAVAGKALDGALRGSAKSRHIVKSCEGEIRKYSQRLAQKSLRKAASKKAGNIVASRTAKIASERAVQKTLAAKTAASVAVGAAIPIVFAAWDILDAFGDYDETMRSIR